MFVNSIVPDLKVLVHPLMGASLKLARHLCHGHMQAGTGEQNMLDTSGPRRKKARAHGFRASDSGKAHRVHA